MGKHEPMSAKAIGIRIKAKGLQKIKYYCSMCNKQCRDDNGFKCHIASEAHQRQALLVYENPEKIVDENSKAFKDEFMFLLKTRHNVKRVLANTVFQDIVKDKHHVHLNSTRWTSLTEFAQWLGDQGLVKVDESERGIMVTYIDRDPETLRRNELEAKRAEQAKEKAIEKNKEIERQRLQAEKLYAEIEKRKLETAPIPVTNLTCVTPAGSGINQPRADLKTAHDETAIDPEASTSKELVERPVFRIEPVSIKKTVTSGFKPPPPKRLKMKPK